MQPVQNKVVVCVWGKGAGGFTPNRFLDLGSRKAAGMALCRLEKAGTVRHLARGLYDYSALHPKLGALSAQPDVIARLLLDREMKRLKDELGYSISYDESFLELVLVEGFDSRFGARPLRRCIERLVGDAIVEQLFRKKEPNGRLIAKGARGTLVLEVDSKE